MSKSVDWSHIGQSHTEVEKYLPDDFKIPSYVQGKTSRRRTKMRVVR